MTYEEKRAAELAADLAKPFLQPQEWRKDHKYRPLLLEPVIDRDKALKEAKLVKQIRKSPLWPEMPYDVGDEEDLDPSAAPKPEWCYEPISAFDYTTHAEFINALLDILAAHPEDTQVQDHLSYAISDYDFPTDTPEDIEELIKAAQKVAEDPLSKIPHGPGYYEAPYAKYNTEAPEPAAPIQANIPKDCPLPRWASNYTDEELDEVATGMGDKDYFVKLWNNYKENKAEEAAAQEPTPKQPAAQEQPATETKPEDEEDYFANLVKRSEPTTQEPTPEQPAEFPYEPQSPFEDVNDEYSWSWSGGRWSNGPSEKDREEAAQEWERKRAAQEPTPQQPAALHFNSLAEYEAWEAGLSQQERDAYWDSLSDFDFMCLWNDLDDEAAAQDPAPLDYLDTEDDTARNEGRDEYIECSAYLRGEAYDKEDYIKANPEDYDENGNWIGYAAATEGDGYQQWTDIQARRGKTA
jgi:hypothetical protein